MPQHEVEERNMLHSQSDSPSVNALRKKPRIKRVITAGKSGQKKAGRTKDSGVRHASRRAQRGTHDASPGPAGWLAHLRMRAHTKTPTP